MSALYQGDNFDEWCEHFQLDHGLKQLLADTGVDFVVDLVEVISFPFDVLERISSQCNSAEFEKFLNACKQTAALAEIPLPKSASAAPISPTAATPTSTSVVTDDEDVAADGKMADLQRRIDELKKAQEESSALTATDLQIHAMEEEIRHLELDSLSRSASKAAEKARRNKEMKTRLDATRQRRRMIDVLEDTLKIAASLDIAFMLDCTGSMGGFINAARDNMQQFVDGLSKIYPDIPLRIAFVGYRDHCDGAQRLAVLRFTTELREFRQILAAQLATGGGDGPEDVFGALNVVNSMEWRSTTRILYHIGDYPCHGTPEFHKLPDDHLRGDPHGLKADVLLNALKRHNVQFYFGKITDQTDKMIARFNEIMGCRFVTTTPLNADNMVSTVTDSVSSSMSASLSTSARTDGGSVKMKEIVLNSTQPSFTALLTKSAVRIGLRLPASLTELVETLTDICLDAPDPLATSVKVAPHPFAKGAMKAAYHGYKCETGEAVVLKQSMAESGSQLTLAKYTGIVANHAAATFLAGEFGKVAPTGCPTIRFCDVCVLQLHEQPDQPYFIQEEQLVGAFEKFSNNSGYCQPSPTPLGTRHEAVQAFSRWTHHVTGGALMVVDCQGVYSAVTRTFTLTDPAIHGTTLTRFGGTNLGATGFKRFYRTHVCNEYCASLKLPVGK